MRSARLALVLWSLLLVGAWVVLVARPGTPAETVAEVLRTWDGPAAAFGLVLAYAVRSLLFLPMTVLTVFAGFLLGPVLGSCVALVGSVASATLTYALARALGPAASRRGAPRPEARGRLAALRSRPFEAVTISRLAAVPGDVVNVAAGMWRVPFLPFAAGTALGGVPGLLAGVFAGASIEGAFVFRAPEIRPGLVIASVSLAALSLVLVRVLRRGRRPPP